MKLKFNIKNKDLVKRISMGGMVVVFGLLALNTPPAEAKMAIFDYIFKTPDLVKEIQQMGVGTGGSEPVIELPKRPATIKTMHVDATAYSSRPQETDGSPFITADGSVVRDGIIAANFIPFGTKIRIPLVYGDKIFEVHDRMNSRYNYRIDVWMDDVQEMREFGIKRSIEIEIVEMGDGVKQWDKWEGRGAELYQIGKYGPADEPLPQPFIMLANNQ